MHHLNITQIGTLIDGKPHYSHPNYALDLAGEDAGIDFWRNRESETCFYCSGAFGSRSTGNTRFFVSCDINGKQKKVLCADGKERVITLAMTHSNTDYRLYHIYKFDEVMYREGTAGRATGNHIHLEVAEGSQRTKYYDNKLGVYRMRGEMSPVDAFYILDGYTQIVDTKGLIFKHCNATKVEEKMPTNAEKLVDYADTQIGTPGRKYMDWAGYDDPWCSEFVSYCAYQLGFIGNGLMPKAGNCKQAHDFYKPKGLLHTKSDYTPKPGDLVYFGKEGLDHTAIVEKVTATDIIVIEGNAGDSDFHKSRVLRTTYKRNSEWLWGYANPLNASRKKVCDMEDKLKKAPRTYVKGSVANPEGVDYILPKGCTAMLVTAHNSTASLNTQWIINCNSNKAFRISSVSTVYVTVKDNNKVTVTTKAGSPRTYWLILED